QMSNRSRRRRPGHIFPTAEEDILNARAEARQDVNNEQLKSSAFRLAFDDPDFLLSEDLRGVRLMLELNKPEQILRENGVEHAVVIFGSARTPTPDMVVAEELELAYQLGMAPQNPGLLEKKRQLAFRK